MKKALLTGASGFVGINLCKELIRQDWQVHILHRNNSDIHPLKELPLIRSVGDITDVDSIMAAVPNNCDAIFHVAASTNLWSRNNDEQRLTNVEGTRNVIQTAMEKQVGRLVHTSSFVVWGFQQQIFNEQTPWVNAGNWINYIHTKREAERLVKDACEQQRLDAVILNPGNVLGAYDKHNWSRFIRLIDTNKLPGIPTARGSFADVREIAKAHITAFEHGHCGENYLLGGVTASFLELCQCIAQNLDRKIPSKPTPASLIRLSGRLNQWLSKFSDNEPEITPEGAALVTHDLVGDSSKAINQLGYKQTSLENMLKSTINWMHQSDKLL